jgi:HEAT repeat protein
MSSQSIDDLIATSLTGDREDDVAWAAVKALHFIGSEEVLDKAVALTQSDLPANRARGADILGQLGVERGKHSTSFVPERLQALTAMLEESDPIVLDSAIIALGHLGAPEGIRAILRFSEHHDENVRYAVAWSLPTGLGDDYEVIDTLIKLMNDSDSDVRDWATFGLGSQSHADSEQIREALYQRLQDADEDTRAEAVVGLAVRKNLRVLPLILEELERDEYGILYEEAASHLLELDGVKPEGWESWRYIEELRSKFNMVDASKTLPPQ